MFTLLQSIEFVIVIIIGGVGGLHGAVLGAIFVVMVDPFLTLLRTTCRADRQLASARHGASSPGAAARHARRRIGGAAGLKGAIYGLIMIVFILFEPYGLYGRWLKVQAYFRALPALQEGDLQAAEDLCEIGAQPMSLLQADEAISLRFGGLIAVDDVSFDVEPRRGLHHDRPQRRRQDHDLQPDQPHLRADRRAASSSRTRHHRACRRTRSPSSASPAPSRTSSCSSTPPCWRTC